MKTTALAWLLIILAVSGSELHAQQGDFAGTWSGTMTSPELPAWRAEDFTCGMGCSVERYEHIRGLLADPKNDARPFAELRNESGQVQEALLRSLLTDKAKQRRADFDPGDDPGIQCVPFAFFRQVLSPLPMRINRFDDRLVFHYEEWEAERIVWLDRDKAPQDMQDSRMGYSVGHYENDNTLVVETSHLSAAIMTPFDSLEHSEQATAVERYVLSEGGDRLDIALTLTDPATFKRPLIWRRAWLRTPGIELYPDECEIISGEL